MATKTNITYVSDLSGKDITDNDAPTVSFAWDGTDYTIDLTSAEAEKFYKAVEPYISAGTKVSGRRGKAKKSTGPNPAEIRAWAKDNGFDVPDRGRIPAEIREAYEKA